MARRSLLLALLLLAGCGPGASDRKPVTPDEGTFGLDSGLALMALDRVGAPLPGKWECAGGCLKPGAYPDLLPGPSHAEVGGTYGPRGDADTGSARWTGEAVQYASAIALPVAAGPVTSRVRIEVKVDGARSVIRLDSHEHWRWVRINLGDPKRAHRVEIRVIDDGAAWGEWIAAGTPHLVTGP